VCREKGKWMGEEGVGGVEKRPREEIKKRNVR